MVWTSSLDVSVGDATKETDYDNLVANVEWLRTLLDAEHDFNTTTGDGSHTAPITALNNASANRLLTVGGTTTELDAEPNLTFDGSTLAVSGGFSASGDSFIGASGTGEFFSVNSTESDNYAARFQNSGANPLGIFINFNANSPDDNTQRFLQANDSTAIRAVLYSDGDWQNHDNSYGGISDERQKQDIVDAASQWDDIKAMRVRKYRFITDAAADPNCPLHIGVIAQELELVSPGLVTYNEGTDTYGVQYSVLYMKAIKCLQECQTRIEALEAAA